MFTLKKCLLYIKRFVASALLNTNKKEFNEIPKDSCHNKYAENDICDCSYLDDQTVNTLNELFKEELAEGKLYFQEEEEQ